MLNVLERPMMVTVRSSSPGSRRRDVRASVETEVLVDLVGDDQEIVLHAQCEPMFELGAREHLAARVAGGADDDRRACCGVIAFRRRCSIERERRQIERGKLRHDAREERGVEVVAVVGLEEDHPVAGIEQRHQCGGERTRGSHGDHDVGLGIGADAVLAGKLVGDDTSSAWSFPRGRVGAAVLADGGDGAVADEGQGGEIADALAQVDAADALAFAGHAADFGLDEVLDAVGGGEGHGGGEFC